jgi:hypothetical protein
LGFGVCCLRFEVWGLGFVVWGLCLLFGCWICDCGLDICYGSWLESTQSFDYKEEFSDHGPGCKGVWGMEVDF